VRSTRRAASLVIEVALVVTALVMGLGRGTTEPSIVNATPALQGHVEAALATFVAHGLARPDLDEIRFDPTDPQCEGRSGLYDRTTRAVLLCFDAASMRGGSDTTLHRSEQRVLLHELAHAWIETHTSAEQRTAFLDLHGLERWNDLTGFWHRRGTEIAAETFVWVLTDTELVPRTIASFEEDVLREGFEIVTGG
jgi:hypothetical protein